MTMIGKKLFYVVMDGDVVFQKGHVNVSDREIDDILKKIEFFYFSSYVNGEAYRPQVITNLQTSEDSPLVIAFPKILQEHFIARQIDDISSIGHYQDVCWIGDCCKLINEITNILPAKYFNFKSISDRIDYVSTLYEAVEFRIKIHLRDIFMCNPYLYEEIYAPNYKEEEPGSIMPNEYLYDFKNKFYSFAFENIFISSISWCMFLKMFKNIVKQKEIDKKMINLIGIMFDYDYISDTVPTVENISHINEEQQHDSFNNFVFIFFKGGVVKKIQVKYTPLLKMLIGYVLLSLSDFYTYMGELEDTGRHEDELVTLADGASDLQYCENQRNAINEMLQNLEGSIKYIATFEG
jgi:hypothetical protein